MAKSVAFGVVHLGIAFTVGYALTGSVAIAGAITLVEPIANTIAHYFFDKGWESPRFTAWRRRVASEVARVAAVDHQRVAADVARGG